jgi:hypothetical protein
VVYADDLTLQLDIDSELDLEHAKSSLARFRKLFPFSTVTQTRSKSGRWHLYVNLKSPMSRTERALAQACLGSDRVRELLNFTYERDGGTGEMFFLETRGVDHELVSLPKAV